MDRRSKVDEQLALLALRAGFKKLSPSARMLLFIMMGLAGASRVCFASQRTLAGKLGRSVRTVKRLVAELLRAGYITPTERQRRTSAWYLLWLPEVDSASR